MEDQYGLVDFFTHQYRIGGSIWMGGQRLTDLLNDKRSSSLEVRNVQVARVITPKEVVATYASAVVEKERIVFAVIRAEAAEVRQRRFYKHVVTEQWDIFLTVPFFELSGKLHVRGKGDLQTMVKDWTSQFVPITQARAVFTLYPEVSFDGEVIVVNKAHIEVICSDSESAS